VLRCNLLPCSSASPLTNNGNQSKESQPETSEHELSILNRLAGLDPIATVHAANEMAFDAERECILGRISSAKRDRLREVIDFCIEGTRSHAGFPW